MIRNTLGWFVLRIPQVVFCIFAWLIAVLWFDVLRIRRRVTVDNVKRAFPHFTCSEAQKLARRSCYHMARNLFEYLYFPFFDQRHMQRMFRFEGLNHVHDALKSGKGVFLLGLHLGNGDLAIAGLTRSNVSVNLISKEFKAGWLNDMWFGIRARHGTKFISVEKSSFDILRALRNNEAVIFVLDQFMGPPSGVATTFFGHPTGTAAGLALFADRTRSPVIPCYAHRESNGQCRLVFLPPVGFEERNTRDETIRHMTQVYTDVIEKIVRIYPEQWMWIHRRWKNFA